MSWRPCGDGCPASFLCGTSASAQRAAQPTLRARSRLCERKNPRSGVFRSQLDEICLCIPKLEICSILLMQRPRKSTGFKLPRARAVRHISTVLSNFVSRCSAMAASCPVSAAGSANSPPTRCAVCAGPQGPNEKDLFRNEVRKTGRINMIRLSRLGLGGQGEQTISGIRVPLGFVSIVTVYTLF